jgi:hypothetical protein
VGEEPRRAPATFRGWQRGACIGGVMILALFTVLLMVGVVLQLLGVR